MLWLWTRVRDGKLILVSSCFLFLACVPELTGLSSSKSTRPTFVSSHNPCFSQLHRAM